MKKLNKVLAVILSLLCVCSIFALPASANGIGDIFSDIIGDSEDKPLLYSVTYTVKSTDDVSIMYQPNPSVSVDGEGTITVTNDTPIAVDHDFVCWKGEDGKLYYAGDEFHVTGMNTLYAVWEEKKDSDSRVIRVIKCAINTLVRIIEKALGIFKIVDDFTSDYYETTAAIA